MFVDDRIPLGFETIQKVFQKSKEYSKLSGFQLTFMGRDALRLVLHSIGFSENDVLLLPAYVCKEVMLVLGSRSNIVFYDVKPDLSIDAEKIATLLFQEKPKAILITHYFGFPQANLPFIKELCERHGVFVIEDCAHSFLSKGGNGEYGDATICSFRKLLPIPDGGGVRMTPGDSRIKKKSSLFPKLYSDILALLTYLKVISRIRSAKTSRTALFHPFASKDTKHKLNMNRGKVLSMSRISEKIIRNTEFKELIKQRRQNFMMWIRLMREVPCNLIFDSLPEGVCPFGFPVLIDGKKHIMEQMKREGILVRSHWDLDPIIEKENKIAWQISAREITLPVYPGIREIDMLKIRDALNAAISTYRATS